MFRLVLELINRMLLFVAAFILVLGGINAVFGTSLGIKIGGERIELPEEFIGVVFICIMLLLFSAVLSAGLHFKKIIGWVKAEPLKAGGGILAGLVVIGVAGYLGVVQLAGGRLPLAVSRGNAEAVLALLEDGTFEQAELGESLYQAMANGDYDIATALIEHGADANHEFGEYDSSLLHAAVLWYEVGATEFLLQQGADPNHVDRLGRSPLVVTLLSRAKAHSDESQREASEIVAMLLAAGADPTLAAANGETPVSIAERFGYTDILAQLES